ncbi:MAG: hypothetical protein ACRCXB_28225 [Aeromonadaceae bacterium]
MRYSVTALEEIRLSLEFNLRHQYGDDSAFAEMTIDGEEICIDAGIEVCEEMISASVNVPRLRWSESNFDMISNAAEKVIQAFADEVTKKGAGK